MLCWKRFNLFLLLIMVVFFVHVNSAICSPYATALNILYETDSNGNFSYTYELLGEDFSGTYDYLLLKNSAGTVLDSRTSDIFIENSTYDLWHQGYGSIVTGEYSVELYNSGGMMDSFALPYEVTDGSLPTGSPVFNSPIPQTVSSGSPITFSWDNYINPVSSDTFYTLELWNLETGTSLYYGLNTLSFTVTDFLAPGNYKVGLGACGTSYTQYPNANPFQYSACGTTELFLTIEDAAPVPEPATMLLLGSGLVGLAGFRRKFKK